MCKKVTDDGKTRLTCNLFRRGASNGITMQTEEQELIRRIAGGETRLCARLADRYGRAVYTLAARIAGCTEDAEELTQDIFLKAFSSLDRFIIGKTKCDGIQNQMRLFGGRVSPKRKATKISHTHTKKHRSNGF